MADPSDIADHIFYQYQRLHPGPPVTSANGALGADDDDEGPNASDGWHPRVSPQQGYHSQPSVGRVWLAGQKKYAAPVRSRENWPSYAAQGAAGVSNSASHSTGIASGYGRTDTTTSTLLPPQQHPYPPQRPPAYQPLAHDPANPYDQPHSSCPLCGTPYQRGPNGQGPSYTPRPMDAMNQHEQTREGPRCPACLCPTMTQLSPTGAPARFTSSGRKEYITGYPSPSSQQQQHLGDSDVTAANANINSTSLPYGSAASPYGAIATTGTSGSGYQVSPAYSPTSTSERTSQVARTQPRDYPLQYPPPANQGSPHNAAYIASASVGAGVYSTPAPTVSEQRATHVSPAHNRTSERPSQVTHTQPQNYPLQLPRQPPPATHDNRIKLLLKKIRTILC